MAVEPLPQLLMVYAAYVMATASPGPSNMAIMGMAMSKGRTSALFLALGVISGSMFWATLAATGISAVLATYAEALFAIKVLAWVAIMSLGLGPDASTTTLVMIVLGCAVLSVLVFGGYAIVFSTAPMIRSYLKARRWIEGMLALAFSYAGIRLLLSKL